MPLNAPNVAPADVALQNLQAAASGHFYLLDDGLTNQQVSDAFDVIIQKSRATEEKREIRVDGTVDGIQYWASFLCFRSQDAPSFLPLSNLRETSYGFALLVELALTGFWYIGVFKKGATGADEALENYLKPPSRRSFSRAFGKGAAYQRLSLKRMTASKHELLASSYEAENLKTALPTLGITRSVPRSLRMRHEKHGSISITPGTFRLQKSGGRCAIDDLAALLVLVAKEVRQSNPNEFLDVLPQEMDFTAKPKSLRPTGVLIEMDTLLDSESLEVWRKNKNGIEHEMTPKLLLRTLSGALDAKKNGGEWDLTNEDGKIVGSLKESARGYRLGRVLDSSVEVRDTASNADTQRLSTWINANETFRVVFSQPDYFYTGGQLYLRRGFDSDVQLVRRAISPSNSLTPADSEKGKPQPKAAGDVQFPAKSIFRIVEDSLLNNSDFLWCSDLGIEWADYISLSNGKIVFAHCKHAKKTTLGATGYQEVLGQAIKNLGSVKSTPAEFSQKIKAAGNTRTWGSTGIQRLRTQARNWTDFERAIIASIANPNFSREVHLVITMLSAGEFDAEAARPKKKGSFIQLIWLLSAFINSCRELGAEAKVICKP